MTNIIFYQTKPGQEREALGACRVLASGEVIAEGKSAVLVRDMNIPHAPEADVVAYILKRVHSPYLWAEVYDGK